MFLITNTYSRLSIAPNWCPPGDYLILAFYPLRKLRLHRGQSFLFRSHGKIQSKWKAWLQRLLEDKHAVSPSWKLFQQIAQVEEESRSACFLGQMLLVEDFLFFFFVPVPPFEFFFLWSVLFFFPSAASMWISASSWSRSLPVERSLLTRFVSSSWVVVLLSSSSLRTTLCGWCDVEVQQLENAVLHHWQRRDMTYYPKQGNEKREDSSSNAMTYLENNSLVDIPLSLLIFGAAGAKHSSGGR